MKMYFLLTYKIFLNVLEITTLIYRSLKSIYLQFKKYVIEPPQKSVDSQIVLITGAGSGIGKALAYKFAQLNAITVLWDINKEAVDKTAQQIRRTGGTAYPYCIDVSDEHRVEQVAKHIRAKVGRVYMVINCAGIVPCLPFKNLSYAQIRRTFEVNILSHFWVIKQFLPVMEETGFGHIVAIASSAGIIGSPYFTAYGSTKFGVVGLMAALRRELDELNKMNEYDIKLTTICPLGISGTGIDVPTRTRFPLLMPIMTLNYAVDSMVKGILTDETFLILPFSFRIIYLILRILPFKVADLLFEYLDYSVEPHGYYAPLARSLFHNREYQLENGINREIENNYDKDVRNHH